jgi:hypothetical protein
MMRWAGVLAIALVLLPASGRTAFAQTADLPALTPAVQSCIDKNARDVERAIPSLTDATDFLVNSVCAGEIADEMHQAQLDATRKMLDGAQKACDDSKAAQGTTSRKIEDVETTDPCQTLAALKLATDSSAVGFTGWTLYGVTERKQPFATSYAAKLLLRLRLSHTNAPQQQDSH